jgi:hypothetical protein
VLFTCYGYLFFYGAWFFQDQGSSTAQSFVLAQRFMLVALPLFVVAYADVLTTVARRVNVERFRLSIRATVVGAVAVVLVVGSIAVQHTAQAHAASLVNVRSALLETVTPADLLVCDKEVAKLILPQWGSRNVYIVADQPAAEVGRDIAAWKAKAGPPGRRALVADWSGGGLGGVTGGDRSATAVVQSMLATTPIPVAPLGLPAAFRLAVINAP